MNDLKLRGALTFVLLAVFALVSQLQFSEQHAAAQRAPETGAQAEGTRAGATPRPFDNTARRAYMFVPFEVLYPVTATAAPRAHTLGVRAHFPRPAANNVSPDSLISVLFSAPMERASVETRWRVLRADTGAAVDGYFEWKNKMLVFYPVPLLEKDTPYRVTLAPGARARHTGATLDAQLEWDFTTGDFTTKPP